MLHSLDITEEQRGKKTSYITFTELKFLRKDWPKYLRVLVRDVTHYEVHQLTKSKCHGQMQARAVSECRYSWSWKEVERRPEWCIWMLRKPKQLFIRVPCPRAVCVWRQVGLIESPKCSQQNLHEEVNIPAPPGQASSFVLPVSYSTGIWLAFLDDSESFFITIQ